jgi:hypothetical protein
MNEINDKKICNKCLTQLSLDMFYKHPKGVNGFDSRCKKCHKTIRDLNYSKKRDLILSKCKQYRKTNYKTIKEKRGLLDKEKKKEYNKTYRQFHNQELNEYSKKYYANNWTKMREYSSNYDKQRLKTDFNFKLKRNIARRILLALKNNSKNGSTMELIGCSIQFFKNYMESKFTEDMSWENHGFRGWHMDHIQPCSFFDLSKPEQQKLCFHYTNLQPLWATTEIAQKHGSKIIGNINKGDKINVV